MIHLKLALFAPLVILLSPVSQGQTFTYSKTVINSNPSANGWGLSFEKSIGYFTSTAYPSYFLGSQTGAHIYDLNTGQVITVSSGGYHYERSKAFRYAGEAYDNVAASVDDTLVIYLNPNNTKQSGWTKQIVNSYAGCHDFYALDLDGDGLLDFACSGTSNYDATSFAVFQNANKSWSASVNIAPSGDGIAPVAVNGLNNGARNNLVGCSPQDSNLYLYKNPGGAAARVPNNWRAQNIGACNEGVSIGTLNVGNRDIVLVASNEGEPVAWPYGMVYYDPGSNPSASPWAQISLGSNFRDVHQIGGAQLGATPLATFGEQEQGSNACNKQGLNDHPDYSGCRVGFFPWTGNGFGAPVIVSNLGTQNQQWLNVGDTLYMVGANHNYYNAVDTGFNLWKVQLSSGGGSPLAAGTYEITSGPQIVDGGFGANNASPYVQFYSINNNAYQHWSWNGSTFQNSGWAGHYMADAGNGTVTANASGDSWSVTSSGSGFVVKNNRTGNYLENNGGSLAMGPAATVWAFSASSTGGGLSSGSLSSGTYEIKSGSKAVDGGFGANNASPYVQFYGINDNAYQHWIWNGSTFVNQGWAGHYMADAGNGTITENSSGDSWSVTSSGGGFVVKDNRTGNYLENNGGTLAMGSAATVWVIQ